MSDNIKTWTLNIPVEDGSVNSFTLLLKRLRRFFIYKLTIDDGIAPCAPRPLPGFPAFLTLALCKLRIRKSVRPGDVIIGLAGKALSKKHGCAENAVIYVAIVGEVLSGKEYYNEANRHRLDCIYQWNESIGGFIRISDIHDGEEDIDLGHYPTYENAYVVRCREFRYFGPNAPDIPQELQALRTKVAGFARGHSVYDVDDKKSEEKRELGKEAGKLVQHLWGLPGAGYTPAVLGADNPRFGASASKISGAKLGGAVKVRDESLKGGLEGERGCGVRKKRVRRSGGLVDGCGIKKVEKMKGYKPGGCGRWAGSVKKSDQDGSLSKD